MRHNFMKCNSFWFLALAFCGVISFLAGGKGNNLNRFLSRYTIGKTVIDYTDPQIYSNGTITASNTVGESFDNFSVGVKLYSFGCESEMSKTGLEIELSNVTEFVIGEDYQWRIQVVPDKLHDSPGSMVDFYDSDDYDDQKEAGRIRFCAMVSSWLNNLQIGYRENNIEIEFEITDEEFSVTNLYLDEDSPLHFVYVDICVCEAFECIDSYQPIVENDNFEVCLTPTSPMGDSRITNFNMQLSNADDNTPECVPVSYGIVSWDPDPLTTVMTDTESSTIMINTLLESKVVTDITNNIYVKGNAVIGVNNEIWGFHKFELALPVQREQNKDDNAMTCIQQLFDAMRQNFFGR